MLKMKNSRSNLMITMMTMVVMSMMTMTMYIWI